MRRPLIGAIITDVPCGVLFAAQVPGDDLKQLYNGRQWIERRGSLRADSPTILRGAAATALNDPATAERLLPSIIRAGRRSDAANHAYRMLARIYQRSGRYRQLLENVDEWSRALPESEDLREAREDAGRFRGLPNQVNGPRRRSTLPHDPGEISVPVSINHKPANYFFDTGAWVSAMTEAEARRLGLNMQGGPVSISDSSGRGVSVRMAVAREVVLGDMRFQNVSFAILPNTEPWVSAPPGQGGILGIPILLAVGRVQWSKNGTVEFGGRSNTSPDRPPNLAFEGNHLLLQVTLLRARLHDVRYGRDHDGLQQQLRRKLCTLRPTDRDQNVCGDSRCRRHGVLRCDQIARGRHDDQWNDRDAEACHADSAAAAWPGWHLLRRERRPRSPEPGARLHDRLLVDGVDIGILIASRSTHAFGHGAGIVQHGRTRS